MEHFSSITEPMTMEPLTQQIGGAKTGLRSQVKPVGTYMYEKVTNIVSYDEKTAYNLLENTQYIFLSIVVCYLYSNLINNLLPYKKNFSKEKRALDLGLHIIALSVGFFLLPKIIQVIPSIMHTSTTYTSYETSAYSGIFIPLFLVSFNFNAISKKISGVGSDTITVKILQDNQPKREVKVVTDEKLRPKQQSKAQVLKTPTQQYPTTSNLPTVTPLNRQQIEATEIGGFGRPKATRTPELKDGNDIRDFLSQVQGDAPEHGHGDMSSRQNDPAEMERQALRPPMNPGQQHHQQQQHQQVHSFEGVGFSSGGGGGLDFAPF
jgi:hypothetical protein